MAIYSFSVKDTDIQGSMDIELLKVYAKKNKAKFSVLVLEAISLLLKEKGYND